MAAENEWNNMFTSLNFDQTLKNKHSHLEGCTLEYGLLNWPVTLLKGVF